MIAFGGRASLLTSLQGDVYRVLLRFPDDHTQEVLGRICYSETLEDSKMAYGFSVIDGFYSLYTSQG